MNLKHLVGLSPSKPRAALPVRRVNEPCETSHGLLRQPPISALAAVGFNPSATKAAAAPPVTTCGVVQVGGQLGLVLTLDGVTLCVVSLGAHSERDVEAVVL